MKKYLLISTVFVFLMTFLGCGPEEDCREGSSKPGYTCNRDTGFWEKGGNGGGNGGTCSEEEEYKYKCINGASYQCHCTEWDNETGHCKYLLWQNPVTCSGSCNESIGVCECSEEEEYSESHKCMGDYQLICSSDESYAEYFWKIDDFCINGCDKSTGECNTCEEGSFTCYKEDGYDISYKCENGHFESDGLCFNGCNKSTGECNSCEYGTFACLEYSGVSLSFRCKEGRFEYHEECRINGCNKSTGECNSCEYGSFACYEGDSYKCSEGRFERYEGCDENGCDSSTGICKNPQERCSTQGAFRCSGDMSQKCDMELWKSYEHCDAGCNAETGRCIY